MGHLNNVLASGGENLKKNFPKTQMPGGLPGGMFKLRFDRCLTLILAESAEGGREIATKQPTLVGSLK